MLIKLTEFAAKRSCTYMFNEAGKRTAKETFRHGKFAFMNGMTKRTSKALVAPKGMKPVNGQQFTWKEWEDHKNWRQDFRSWSKETKSSAKEELVWGYIELIATAVVVAATQLKEDEDDLKKKLGKLKEESDKLQSDIEKAELTADEKRDAIKELNAEKEGIVSSWMGWRAAEQEVLDAELAKAESQMKTLVEKLRENVKLVAAAKKDAEQALSEKLELIIELD